MQYPLTEAERVWLRWYRRLRVARYIGTAADLYTRLTGRPHPRARFNRRMQEKGYQRPRRG